MEGQTIYKKSINYFIACDRQFEAGETSLASYEVTEQSLNVVGIIVHSEYNHENFKNDIAMVVTDTDIEFSNNVKPISLPEDAEKAQLYAEGAPVTVIGKLFQTLILDFHYMARVKIEQFYDRKTCDIDHLYQEILPNIVTRIVISEYTCSTTIR